MLTSCANPNCDVSFAYATDGKLFILDDKRDGELIRRVYWLCGDCAKRFTVVAGPDASPRIEPLQPAESSTDVSGASA